VIGKAGELLQKRKDVTESELRNLRKNQIQKYRLETKNFQKSTKYGKEKTALEGVRRGFKG